MNEEQEKQPLGASPGPPSDEYVPFGLDWVKEMSKFPKDALIERLRKSLMHCQQYDPTRKTNAKTFAETEIDILLKLYPTEQNPPIIKDFIPEILALVDKFGRSGQSGGSAPYTASAISDAVKKLCLFKPIADITGEDSEWANNEIDRDNPVVQNKRCTALFKQTNGRAYYLDAIIFKNEKGHTYSSNSVRLIGGGKIGSRQIVHAFPWKPKTFYIDVIETEVAKDDFEFTIKDMRQLDQVWEVYDPFENEVKS